MGVAELKKVELYFHKSVREDVAEVLQRKGACQIIEDPAEDRSRQADIEERLRECEEQEARARYLLRALGGYYKEPFSDFDRMMGEGPSLSLAELARTAQKTNLKELEFSVKQAETRINELRSEASQIKANEEILSRIQGFPYALRVLREGTRTLKGVLGALPPAQLAALKKDLSAYAEETDVITSGQKSSGQKSRDKEIWAAVFFARPREPEILELCAKNGMSFIEIPAGLTDTVEKETAKLKAELARCQSLEHDAAAKLRRTAEEWMPSIQAASDHWGILRDRYRALAAGAETGSAARTRFWIPSELLPSLQKQIESLAPCVAFSVSDPGKEDSPPTLLKNRSFARPTNALTNLYSPPPYGELDPTPYLAPFFFVFFGMCLGDAGYALVIGAALWKLFKKYRKIPSNLKDFIHIFSIGAVTTFLYGAITGSFFGDSIDAFFFMAPLRGIKDALLFLDPIGEPMKVLGLSLFLGVCHLMFGLIIAACDEFRKGNFADAIGGKISWILFVVGLILIGAGAAGALPEAVLSAAQGMTLVGACLIFWYGGRDHKNIFLKIGAGLYALYGSTAYLGDILSYSRLLALGLGSAVIGTVINLLGTMAADIPYVGFLLFIVIVAGGHVFSIVVNILGAFVHSMRLQYVEFFGKFYSGGGQIFKPLIFSTQYVEISDRQN